MCKYCEKDKRKKRNSIINLPIISLRIIENNELNALEIKSYNHEKQVVNNYKIINYCPMCRKEAGRVSTKKLIERPIELLRKISKEIYDNEFYIETAILSYQAQEEKTYTFFRDDNQKDELRKYSWCQRPDSTNMSLHRFIGNGEIEGYMSESLAEHYGLQKVDLNEFMHKFVKPLVKYKLGLEEESYDK